MSQNDVPPKKAKGRVFTNLPALLLCGMIAVIAVADLVSSSGQMISYKSTRAITNLRDLQIHILSFRTNTGEPLTQLQDLAVNPFHMENKGWRRFAKASELIDPWGHPYVYRVPGQRNPTSYDLFSLGPDGQEGTEDDIWGE